MGCTRRWGAIRDLYNQGNVAIVHGVGYENSPRSHFRSMDIWHTCEPDDVGTEGWLGKVIRDIDPNKENVVTGVSFGPSMFRAMAVPGVPVACVEDLNNYGLMPGISAEEQRQKILNRFSRLYGQASAGAPSWSSSVRPGLDALHGRGHPEGRAGAVLVRHRVRRHNARQEASRASLRCTWLGLARACSTATMAASTRTRGSPTCYPACGTTYPPPSTTSSTTCERMTHPIMW